MDTKIDYENELFFCPATLKLGEIHWHILRAANLMDARTTLTIKLNEASPLPIVRYEYTDFGKEVGRDEIHWWVFKKETDIAELYTRTQRALDAVQVLKQSSANLKSNRPKAYSELLIAQRHFAEEHIAAIDELHGYVHWLSDRDTLAP